MILRDYQQQAIVDLRESLKRGNRSVCCCLSVGSGKSAVAKKIIELSKGKKILFSSFRVILIDQLKSYFENLEGFDIDFETLQYIGKTKTKKIYDLAIIDEAWGHSSKLKNNIQSKFMITLSGSPVKDNGEVLEFDEIIKGVQLCDLVDMGYAKPIKVLSTSKIDTSKLKTVGADFSQKESYNAMNKSSIKKDIIETYQKYCKDRLTLIFGINIQHCEDLKEQFLENRITAETYHSKKSEDNIIEKYKNREIEVLISVSKLNVGFDHPPINCVMFCRPTKSIPMMIQSVGRSTRLNPDKPNDYALVIDMCEVVKNCGHPLQRLDFNKKSIKREFKKCKCGGELETIEKQIKDKSELSYTLVTYKRCKTCKEVTIQEEMKVIELIQCDECLKPIDKNITMSTEKDKILFSYECTCGNKETKREIILSQAELKEIEYNEIMQTETWERVKKMLLASCKRCGYNHRYSVRLIEYMQDKGVSIKDAIRAIEDLDSKGHKISKLMYGYFR